MQALLELVVLTFLAGVIPDYLMGPDVAPRPEEPTDDSPPADPQTPP